MKILATRGLWQCPALLLAMAAVAAAQTPAPAAQAPTQQTAAAASPAPGDAAAGQAPAAVGFSYDPADRRDPFVSLLRRGSETEPRAAGARPPGLPGLETSEITLKGTVAGRTGYVAIVQGSDNKTYIVREGERLLDGTVRAITQNAIVIVQQVNDPLSLEKQREVRKLLRQTEEAKQ
ncbi:MAG: pilus assembly protein PilP [Vicinamibacterales bacterium]